MRKLCASSLASGSLARVESAAILIQTTRTFRPSRPGGRWRHCFVCWTDYRPRGSDGPSAHALLPLASFVRLFPLYPAVDGVAVVHRLGSRARTGRDGAVWGNPLLAIRDAPVDPHAVLRTFVHGGGCLIRERPSHIYALAHDRPERSGDRRGQAGCRVAQHLHDSRGERGIFVHLCVFRGHLVRASSQPLRCDGGIWSSGGSAWALELRSGATAPSSLSRLLS